ncbi:protein indeterminate-domain 7 [Oryza brachyantha]|uniref:protein indeterminate-domain 7 n=1 Tax=Oryza brachyantha TaxID=4533 RepID=UPI001ADC922C|nr:protein indeterminate-domain 7 [Oryza brachyantha]
MFHHHLQQQQQFLLDEADADAASADQQESSMSNLTSSASAAAPPPSSGGGGNNNKRKRSLPGNPDPEAEVVALSPATLMATNRFVCEICGKGFQRDQNLQLHRRGHNLPWKLKQRGSKEAVRKKVYICPEASCVHHDPSRALGDLTGIKKHFFRKHGEKKWKCDKCSKKYAVHSDWKAHSKICGTREYKCDCGTIFSRRDSFITHRAFCDALTEESAKAIGGGMPAAMAAASGHHHHQLLFSPPVMAHQELAALQEQQQQQQHHHQDIMQSPHQHQQLVQNCGYAVKPEMAPWPTMPYEHHHPLLQPLCNAAAQSSATSAPTPPQLPAAAAHLSATALLQKAAQMGATIGGAGTGSAGAHYAQMASGGAGAPTSAAGSATFGLGLSCLNTQQDGGGGNGLVPAGVMGQLARTASHGRSGEDVGGGGGGGGTGTGAGGGSDGMTRDFLGLRAFSHRDILLAGFDSSCMGHVNAATNAGMACYEPPQHGQPQNQHQQQHQSSSNEPWHGMGSHS